MLEIVITSNQISVWCCLEKCFMPKPCNNVLLFCSLLNITFPHEFIFVFICSFIGAISSKEYRQKWEFRKKIKSFFQTDSGSQYTRSVDRDLIKTKITLNLFFYVVFPNECIKISCPLWIILSYLKAVLNIM